MKLFPSATLIRLYELLKNSRESFDSITGNANIKAPIQEALIFTMNGGG
ncbi:hypothetical protein [Ottowia flava]|nr:hypothetical protein [Ottowia sp. GY511]